MKRRYILIIWSILLTLLPLLNGCIREEEFDNTPQGNFEALWKIIDEQYCFLDYKQIDWDAIHDKYQPLITPGMSYDGLFEILGNMLAELKDGHVNLYSSSNMARYWDWYLDYPRNFNESIIEKYLGRDYRIAGGAKYTILEDNIGYIYYGDFSSGIGNGNLDEILLYLSACNGLIIDVRNNGGGNLTNATRMAQRFTNEKVLTGYIQHKTTLTDSFLLGSRMLCVARTFLFYYIIMYQRQTDRLLSSCKGTQINGICAIIVRILLIRVFGELSERAGRIVSVVTISLVMNVNLSDMPVNCG